MIETRAPGTSPSTSPSNRAIIGRDVLPADTWDRLADAKPGAGGENQVTDALHSLTSTTAGLYNVVIRGSRHGAGDKLGYVRANLSDALERPGLPDGVIALCRELVAAADRASKG